MRGLTDEAIAEEVAGSLCDPVMIELALKSSYPAFLAACRFIATRHSPELCGSDLSAAGARMEKLLREWFEPQALRDLSERADQNRIANYEMKDAA